MARKLKGMTATQILPAGRLSPLVNPTTWGRRITNGPVFRSVMSQTLRTFNVQPSTGEPARLPQYAK